MSRNRGKAVSIAGVEQAMLQRGGGGGGGEGGSGSISSSRSVLIDVGSVSSPESVLNRRLVILLCCLTQRVFTVDCDPRDLRVNRASF
jgi:hypothetical protein